ncbi:MAG: tetratricopeptide repeat protein [Pyrinomonadaceae bacterium]
MFVDSAVELFSANKENTLLTADALVLSAIVSAVKGQNAAAIEKLKRAVALAPAHFDANFSLGRALYGNGDTESAIKAFQAAVKIQPDNARAKFFLATALEKSDDLTAALTIYRELVRIAPNAADGYLGIGSLLVKTDGATSAEGLQDLQKAVALNGNLYEARVMLGKTLLKLNRAAESIEHLQKAAAIAPNNPEPHYQLAIAYRRLGKKAEADAEQEAVKKIHETRRGVRVSEN